MLFLRPLPLPKEPVLKLKKNPVHSVIIKKKELTATEETTAIKKYSFQLNSHTSYFVPRFTCKMFEPHKMMLVRTVKRTNTGQDFKKLSVNLDV